MTPRWSLVFGALAAALSCLLPLGNAQAAPATPAPQTALVTLADGRSVAPDIARILQRGELLVAMNSVDTFPFFHEHQGELAGSDVALMRDLAAKLGVGVRFVRTPKTFDGVVDLVAAGGADVGISKLARTLHRTQKVFFSEPYQRIDHALLLNRLALARIARDRPLPEVIRQYTGTIGVIRNSAWVEFGRLHFPHARIVEMPTWQAVVDATRRGEVSAAYRDEYEVRTILKEQPALALTLRTVSFADIQSNLAIAVGLRDTSLLAYVNEFLAQRIERPALPALSRASQ